ncbi:Dihydrofolate reductase [Pseudonocardia thermophila]|uniref:Dihydrofolate reductase n=1 Tax=Pseudonocardia thermophila TaxID=1848 RepID=A0A1M6YM25_PSETH|nr:dihydrofolate reductase family protein [Pseudonocardia thermophila]SHL19079.1 Dihydrofolate reductase [Pseudonocardia thermophila]
MRKLLFGMNVSLDGYVAAPGDDISWSTPSSDLFRWWLDQERATELTLYGRRLWETMSAYWPTGDEQPGATPDEIAFARHWRDTPKIVFSATLGGALGWNARAVSGDPVAEITQLKSGNGGPMSIGGATLAAAAVRAGLVDEFTLAVHPVVVGGGAPFFPALGARVPLELRETRTFPGGVVLLQYTIAG